MGLKHEHKNPYGGIKWNRTAVFEYYRGPPDSWDDKKIEHNILTPLRIHQTNGMYDPDSIMHYYIKPEFTMNRCCGTKYNYNLSKGDKITIQQLYGKFRLARGK